MMRKFVLVLITSLFAIVALCQTASAIPPFARKYKTSCSTCHYAYPKLNGFGQAFKNNGYRYPGGDENFVKDEPTSLGSEAYKRVFPNAIWPSDIPGLPPIGLNLVGRMEWKPNAKDESTGDPDGTAESSFTSPHELEILFGSTLGETLSVIGEVEMEFEDGQTTTGIPFKIGYNPHPWLNVSFGSNEIFPIGEHHRSTVNHNNVSNLRTESRFRARADNAGVEVWGAGDGYGGQGGWEYAIGVANGTGGFEDANSDKDFYGRVSYKLFGHPVVGGGEEEQASSAVDFWRDDQIKLGAFAYRGIGNVDNKHVEDTGLPDGEVVDDEFSMLGGTLSIWFNRFQLNSVYMSMNTDVQKHNDGVDPRAIRKSAWYVEGMYVVNPWLIPLIRFERTDTNMGVAYDENTNPDEETNLIANVTFMLRADVKVLVEYLKPFDDHRNQDDLASMQVSVAF